MDVVLRARGWIVCLSHSNTTNSD